MNNGSGRDWVDKTGALGTVASALIALAFGVYIYFEDESDNQKADAVDVRAARQQVIADVLQMRQYDSEGGAGNQQEIVALAADATELIDHFGHAQLHLSPVLYRLMADYVAYSTKRPDLAQRLAEKVIKFGDPESDDLVFAHRVLGHVAAQRLEPGEVRAKYDEALAANKDFSANQPNLGVKAEEFTRAYRLLSAYLGALRSEDGDVHAEFCELTRSWQADRTFVRRLASRDRVPGQLRRFHAKDDLARLWAVCP